MVYSKLVVVALFVGTWSPVVCWPIFSIICVLVPAPLLMQEVLPNTVSMHCIDVDCYRIKLD